MAAAGGTPGEPGFVLFVCTEEAKIAGPLACYIDRLKYIYCASVLRLEPPPRSVGKESIRRLGQSPNLHGNA